MGKLKKIGIGVGISVAIFFAIIIATAAYLASTGNYQSTPSVKPEELTPDKIKAISLKDLTYDELMRHNELYVGEMVHFNGKLIQVQNIYGNNYVLLVDVSKEFLGLDIIWLNYQGERFLEDDNVGLWGKVKGLKDYTTFLGAPQTVPEVDVKILELIKKDKITSLENENADSKPVIDSPMPAPGLEDVPEMIVKEEPEQTMKEESETMTPFTGIISVPSGSSVPGCEETNECFIPADVTVNVGDTVTWSNDDSAAHTVTSGTPSDGPDGIFDSSLFMAGTTFSQTFDEVGEYNYFCMVHPWMTGKIQVN